MSASLPEELRSSLAPPPSGCPPRTLSAPAPPGGPPNPAPSVGGGDGVAESAGGAADVLPAELEYRLIRQIGAGMYGQVYEAEAAGGFRVAVKRITRSVDHPASQGEVEALE